MSTTYHFLQAINKVTDDNTEAFELLEHGAEFLARAFAHIRACVIRLLTYYVCCDGRAHVHNFCALAHNVGVIWQGGGETMDQGEWASKQMNEQQRQVMENRFERWDERNSRTLTREQINFLFCCNRPKDHSNVVITVFIVFPTNRCSGSSLWAEEKKKYLFEKMTVNLRNRWLSTVGGDGTAEQERQKSGCSSCDEKTTPLS